MKCMPMNAAGRSVAAPSRVIGIEEVLRGQIASGFSSGTRLAKIFFLISSFSVAASMTMSQSAKPAKSVAGGAPGRVASLASVDAAACAHLAVQVLRDGRQRLLQRRRVDVDQHHVHAGQRAHMGDAVAHQAGADHADLS